MRLLLMRHAGTAGAKDGVDFERLLTAIGELEAREAGKFLTKYKIDKQIVSYAKRTIQTHAIVQEQIAKSTLEIVTELYDGNMNTVMELLCAQDAHNKNILVIGHNPLIYDIALTLAKSDAAKYDVLTSSMMPTGRVIIIDFPEMDNWQDLYTRKGDIIEIFTPNIAD